MILRETSRQAKYRLLWRAGLALSACLFLLAGCSFQQTGTVRRKNVPYICYLNAEEDGLYKKDYDGELSANDAAGTEELLDEVIGLLQAVPDSEEYTRLLPDSVKLQRRTLENGRLMIDFSHEYQAMDSTREVLVRAGYVRTLVQLDAVSEVLFTVDGGPCLTPTGELLGVMNADTFVEDAGKQINAIQHTAINLYFADAEGKALRQEARSIYYSASKPLEWAIVERIIAGPKVEGNYPTVPPTTQIISVSSAGGICYVNLTQTFVANALNIDEKLPVYSIANSIIDNCRDVTSVQFAIDGDSNIIFRQETDLTKPLEANMDLVKKD